MKIGPLSAAATMAVAALAATSAHAVTFVYTGALQFWSSPAAGFYRITAWGAGGGTGGFIDFLGLSVHSEGGRGAGVQDRVFLPRNLIVAVGVGGAGQGDSGGDAGGGGGGGSFVVVANGAPLVIAGGGGGGGWNDVSPATGGDGVFGPVNGGFGGPGGFQGGGGGGGFYSDGGEATFFDGQDIVPGGAGGGQGWPGLAGGIGGSFIGPPGFDGGFGGGGGGGRCAGGGGGGFGGGRGAEEGGCDGEGGGGGGSFASIGGRFLGYAPRYENGSVTISSVPEPAGWAFMIVGFASLGALLRRRRALAAPAGA